jgi:hypothetical protein
MRDKLLKAGVANLKKFGYPSVNTENILTNRVYSMFFKEMLDDNAGISAEADTVIEELKEEIKNNAAD